MEDESSSNAFENDLDAYYLKSLERGDYVAFSSVSHDSLLMAKQTVPNLSAQLIYLSFSTSVEGDYTLSLKRDINRDLDAVILEDIVEGEFTELMHEGYSFKHVTGEPVQRFKIHFSQESAEIAKRKYNGDLWAWFIEDQLMLDANFNLRDAKVKVFNLNGVEVTSGNIEDIYLFESGVYIVQIQPLVGNAQYLKVIK